MIYYFSATGNTSIASITRNNNMETTTSALVWHGWQRVTWKKYDIDTSVRLCEQMFREAIEEMENQEENHA